MSISQHLRSSAETSVMPGGREVWIWIVGLVSFGGY